MSESTLPEQKWYALTVPYQHERQAEKALQSQGLETLVPVYRSRRQWSDRVKDVEMPLFAGYVLCHFGLRDRIQVLDTPGVARIVGLGAHRRLWMILKSPRSGGSWGRSCRWRLGRI